MTDWKTNWLTKALELSRALKHLRHSRQSRYSRHSRHSGTRALGHSRHLGTWDTWALQGHLGTRTLKTLGHLASQGLGHSGTRKALGHSGTWALEALYLVDSLSHLDKVVKWLSCVVSTYLHSALDGYYVSNITLAAFNFSKHLNIFIVSQILL